MPINEGAVQALFATVTSLTAEINARKDLERRLRDALTQLNAERDIVTRVPREITSDIFLQFLQCLPAPDPNAPNHTARGAPMVLLSVCRSWRERALSTTGLWDDIRIQFPRPEGFAQLVDLWLRAAAPRKKTSLSLRGHLDPAVAAVVQQYSQSIRTLEISFMTAKMLPHIAAPFLSLTALTIAQYQGHYTGDDSDDDRLPPDDFASNPISCVALLRSAPALVECTFDSTYFHSPIENPTPATHSALQTLRLGAEQPNSAAILAYLTLPALRTLHMTDFDIELDTFVSFVRRSAPLRSLSIPLGGWTIDAIRECFRLLSGLTTLDLACRGRDLSFLGALAASQTFLPNLRCLTIRGVLPDAIYYQTLVSTLATRRAVIQTFRLLVGNHPPANIVAALRQLQADGMEIHVGFHPGENLI
ncbi:hypothetical protein C8R46DRAFT_366283 [Mycena filopes]|nr:hypothetical protein C8R46DRAFT_366283 [Mycena filopes]